MNDKIILGNALVGVDIIDLANGRKRVTEQKEVVIFDGTIDDLKLDISRLKSEKQRNLDTISGLEERITTVTSEITRIDAETSIKESLLSRLQGK